MFTNKYEYRTMCVEGCPKKNKAMQPSGTSVEEGESPPYSVENDLCAQNCVCVTLKEKIVFSPSRDGESG